MPLGRPAVWLLAAAGFLTNRTKFSFATRSEVSSCKSLRGECELKGGSLPSLDKLGAETQECKRTVKIRETSCRKINRVNPTKGESELIPRIQNKLRAKAG